MLDLKQYCICIFVQRFPHRKQRWHQDLIIEIAMLLLMAEIWLTSWYSKYPIIYMVLGDFVAVTKLHPQTLEVTIRHLVKGHLTIPRSPAELPGSWLFFWISSEVDDHPNSVHTNFSSAQVVLDFNRLMRSFQALHFSKRFAGFLTGISAENLAEISTLGLLVTLGVVGEEQLGLPRSNNHGIKDLVINFARDVLLAGSDEKTRKWSDRWVKIIHLSKEV